MSSLVDCEIDSRLLYDIYLFQVVTTSFVVRFICHNSNMLTVYEHAVQKFTKMLADLCKDCVPGKQHQKMECGSFVELHRLFSPTVLVLDQYQ